MTHHQFGAVVGVDGGAGLLDMGRAVLLNEYDTVAVDSISDGQHLPVIGLQLVGRLNKSKDTAQVVFVMSVMDAGALAGALMNAAQRIGEEEARDFQVGFGVGLAGDRP